MSIFKGDSIYKTGGGSGGGYKDGGELVDADLIKVENNSISSYENETRDPVNFYIEANEGDVLNTVIEFTTQVNTTVNVYILKNGFYFLLGVIGSNSVNAGDDSVINITGNSYEIEQTTPIGDPSIDINGALYSVKKIGNQYWTTSDYDVGGTNGKFINPNIFNTLSLPSGWRVPNNTDFDNLKTYCLSNYGNAVSSLRTVSGWGTTYTNDTGFSAYPNGILNVWQGNIIQFTGSRVSYWSAQKDSSSTWSSYTMDNNGFNYGGGYSPNDYKYCLRFVKDA